MLSPALLLHIIAANVSLIAGAMSMFLRKGSSLHRAAGTAYAVAMLTATGAGAYVATVENPFLMNAIGSLLTFYLVSTGWMAGSRRDGAIRPLDVATFLLVLGIVAVCFTSGVEASNSANGRKDGVPAAMFYVFGSIALLCATSDVRMFFRRGLTGVWRLRRHLWRMGLSLLFAGASLYPGNAKLFPMWLRETKVLLVPHLLLLGAMIYWMIRVSRRKRVAREKVTVGFAGSAVGSEA